jgi:hypothetical protein
MTFYCRAVHIFFKLPFSHFFSKNTGNVNKTAGCVSFLQTFEERILRKLLPKIILENGKVT